MYLYLSIWSLMIGYEKLSVSNTEDMPVGMDHALFNDKQWQDTIRQIVRTILTTP